MNPYATRSHSTTAPAPQGLAEVLERVLDKGLVVAGDIQINLLDIELLTIKIRLLVASADTAEQMGIDWWRHDAFLSGKDRELDRENALLRDRVARLEEILEGGSAETTSSTSAGETASSPKASDDR